MNNEQKEQFLVLTCSNGKTVTLRSGDVEILSALRNRVKTHYLEGRYMEAGITNRHYISYLKELVEESQLWNSLERMENDPPSTTTAGSGGEMGPPPEHTEDGS